MTEIHEVITSLTDYDIKQLIEAEDELSRAQSFKRLFPSPTSRQYIKYFQEISYSNLLLDEWEQCYCDNREKGNPLTHRLQFIIYDYDTLLYMILFRNRKTSLTIDSETEHVFRSNQFCESQLNCCRNVQTLIYFQINHILKYCNTQCLDENLVIEK